MKKVTLRRREESSHRGFVRAVALLIDESELHIFEYIDYKLSKISYAYHFQTQDGELILRYDNEPHYPELTTFPHHKHISDASSPESSEPVIVEDVLAEAAAYIASKGRKNEL